MRIRHSREGVEESDKHKSNGDLIGVCLGKVENDMPSHKLL